MELLFFLPVSFYSIVTPCSSLSFSFVALVLRELKYIPRCASGQCWSNLFSACLFSKYFSSEGKNPPIFFIDIFYPENCQTWKNTGTVRWPFAYRHSHSTVVRICYTHFIQLPLFFFYQSKVSDTVLCYFTLIYFGMHFYTLWQFLR